MLSFASENALYRRTGLCLLLAQFFLFVFALPPLQAGIWLQTEPVVYALLLFGLCNASWCLLGISAGTLKPCSLHPLWYCLMLWLGWQLLAGAAAANPWRSWFGPPETGEGAAWYVALFLIMAVASPFWQEARYRRCLLAAAFISVLIQCSLYVAFPYSETYRYVLGSWRPSSWAAYVAFMAGYIWVAWAMAGYKQCFSHYVLMVGVMVLILAASHNVTAMILLGGAMLASGVVAAVARHRGIRRFLHPGRFWRMVAMALCIMPLGWIIFSACFPVLEPYTREIAPLALLSDKDGSMGARLSLNQMAVNALHHEPRRWLVGNGWGGFSDITFAYVMADGVYVYKDGQRSPNSLMVDGYSFHSHNQPLEALVSLGLPGLILWLLLPLAALWTLPRRSFWLCAPMLVGLAGLCNIWYELAQCLPYKALALAALSSSCERRRGQWALPAGWLKAGLLVAAVAMGLSAWQQKKAIAYGVELREASHALPYKDYSLSWLETDIRLGGDRLRNSAQFYASWLALKKQKYGAEYGLDNNDRGWYAQFLQAARDASQSPRVGPYAASMELQLYYDMLAAMDSPVFSPLTAQAIAALPDAVVRLAQRAPLRDDLATPFLLMLPHIAEGQADRQIEILNRLLAVAPDHRGALWVLGGVLRTLPGREMEGLALQRRAASLGVERVYPVTDASLAALK